ncbi:uncharacterized protein [Macrobrachium rosenbergii]|uniref:uncharacterized protein isoform X2 n=1 Tax=Macrobrachium rosenbergii TaxID=79674 RepID=UPI0034D4622A
MGSPTSGTARCGVFDMNLLKINTFVRTKFEEAARRYGSEKRTAAMFPPSPTAAEPTYISGRVKTSSISKAALPAVKSNPPTSSATTRSTVSHANRWSFKSFTNVIVSSSEGTEITNYYAENQHLEAGISLSRSSEEDTIQVDIQRMRNDFVQHKIRPAVQHQPPPLLDVLKNPVIFSRSDFRPKGQGFVPPLRGRQIPGGSGVRHVRPLFRNNPFIDLNEVEQWSEKDFTPDEMLVEENSPPRPSYHIYRVNVDGTTCPLPVTVLPLEKQKDQESTSVFISRKSMEDRLTPAPQVQLSVLQGTSADGPGGQVWQSKDRRLLKGNNLSKNTLKNRTEINFAVTKVNKSKKTKGVQKESLLFVNENGSKNERPVKSHVSKPHCNDEDVEIIKICEKSDISVANFILLSSDSSPESKDSVRGPNLNSVASHKPATNSLAVLSENLGENLSRPLNDKELPDLSKCNSAEPGCCQHNLDETLKGQPSTRKMNEVTLEDFQEVKKSHVGEDEESLPETIIFLKDEPGAGNLLPDDIQATAEKNKLDRKSLGEISQSCDTKSLKDDTSSQVTFHLLSISSDEQNNNTSDNDSQETELIRISNMCPLSNELVRNGKRRINFVKENNINVHSIHNRHHSNPVDKCKRVQSELINIYPALDPVDKHRLHCSELIDLFPVPDMEQSIAIKSTVMNGSVKHSEASNCLEAYSASFKKSGKSECVSIDVSNTNLLGRGTDTITQDSLHIIDKRLKFSVEDEDKDYCEFINLSSLIFVSDGKTVFRFQKKVVKAEEFECDPSKRLPSQNLSAVVDKINSYESLVSANNGVLDSYVNEASNIFLYNDLRCNDDSEYRENKDETYLNKSTEATLEGSAIGVEEWSEEILNKSSHDQQWGREENRLHPVDKEIKGKAIHNLDVGQICSSDNVIVDIAILNRKSPNMVDPEMEESLEEMLARERQSFVISELVKEYILMGERGKKIQCMQKYVGETRTCHSKRVEAQTDISAHDAQKHKTSMLLENKELSLPNVFKQTSQYTCSGRNCSCCNGVSEKSINKGVAEESCDPNTDIRAVFKVSEKDPSFSEVTRSAFDPNKVIGSQPETCEMALVPSEQNEVNTSSSNQNKSGSGIEPNEVVGSNSRFEEVNYCELKDMDETDKNCEANDTYSKVNGVAKLESETSEMTIAASKQSKVRTADSDQNEVNTPAFDQNKSEGSDFDHNEMTGSVSVPDEVVGINSDLKEVIRNQSELKDIVKADESSEGTDINSRINDVTKLECKPADIVKAGSDQNDVNIAGFNRNKSTGSGFDLYEMTGSSSMPNEAARINSRLSEVSRNHSELDDLMKTDKSSVVTDTGLRINIVSKLGCELNEVTKLDSKLVTMTETRSELNEMLESDSEYKREDSKLTKEISTFSVPDSKHQMEEYSTTDTFAKPVCYSRLVNVMEKSQIVGVLEIHNLECTSESGFNHEVSGIIEKKSMDDLQKGLRTTNHDVDHDVPLQVRKEVENNDREERVEDDSKGNKTEDSGDLPTNKETEIIEQDSRNLKIMTNFQRKSGTTPPMTMPSLSLGELMHRISEKIQQLKRRESLFYPKEEHFEERKKRMREFESTLRQFTEKSKKVKSSGVPEKVVEIPSKNEAPEPLNFTLTHTVSQQPSDVCSQLPKLQNEHSTYHGCVDENKNENENSSLCTWVLTEKQLERSTSEILLVDNKQPGGGIQAASPSHECADEIKQESKNTCEYTQAFKVEHVGQSNTEVSPIHGMHPCDNIEVLTPFPNTLPFTVNAKSLLCDIPLTNDSQHDCSDYVCKTDEPVVNASLLQITDNQDKRFFSPLHGSQDIYSNEQSPTLAAQQLPDVLEDTCASQKLAKDGTQIPCIEIPCGAELETRNTLCQPTSREEITGDIAHTGLNTIGASSSPVLSMDEKHVPDYCHSALSDENKFQGIQEDNQISELQSLRNLAKLYNDSVQPLEGGQIASLHENDKFPQAIDEMTRVDCVNSDILEQIPSEHQFPTKVTCPAVSLPQSQMCPCKGGSQQSTCKLEPDDHQLASETVQSSANNSCSIDGEVRGQEPITLIHNNSREGPYKRKRSAEETDIESSKEEHLPDYDDDDDDAASHPTSQRSRKKQKILMQRIAVPLNEVHQQCLKKLEDAGETLLALLKNESVSLPKFDRGFLNIRAGITRFLLNQLVRTRNVSADHKSAYQTLLMVHGLVKAADLLMHYGVESAKQCLQEFSSAHHILIPNCYDHLLSELELITSKETRLTHPKVQILKKKLKMARKKERPSDSDFKVLIVCKRESESVCQQLQKTLGASRVGLLPSVPDYQEVLQLIDEHCILVWSEGNGVDHIPCSQFSLVVEWEASEFYNTRSCVDCCLRQNIQVVALYTAVESSSAYVENSRPESSMAQSKDQSTDWKPKTGEGTEETASKERYKTFTFVASEVVTDNAELHYLLSSVFRINLVERRLRDLVDGEHSERCWADIVVDERTGILLRPLFYLRHDSYRNAVTQQLILLSLQFTKCYLLLYQHPPSDTRYVFGNRVVKSLNRLVATCALLKTADYQVSLLYAYNLQQVGQIVRTIGESSLSSSVSWDEDQWINRPWLTPWMSSHERLLLSLPCLNPISAQVILTVLSLRHVLTMPLPALIKSLPWISNRVLATMYHLLHSRHISVCKEVMNESLDVIDCDLETPGLPHQANPASHVQPVANPCTNVSNVSQIELGEEKAFDFSLNQRDINEVVFAAPVISQGINSNVVYNDTQNILQGCKQENFNYSATFKNSPTEDMSALLNPKEFLNRITDESSPNLKSTCCFDKGDEIKKEPNWNSYFQDQQHFKCPEQPLSMEVTQQSPYQEEKLQPQHSNPEGQVLRRQQRESLCQNTGTVNQLQSHASQVVMPPQSLLTDNSHGNLREEYDGKQFSARKYQDHPSFLQFSVTSPYFADGLKVQDDNSFGYQATQMFSSDEPSAQPLMYPATSSVFSQGAHKTLKGPFSMTDHRNYHEIPMDSNISNRSFVDNTEQVGREKATQPPYQHVPDARQSLQYSNLYSCTQPSLASQQNCNVTEMTLPYHRESMTATRVPPPSPLVTLRQDGRGNDYPDHYEFLTSQVKIPRSASNRRLSYTKVPGQGGQTKLVFHPRRNIRERNYCESKNVTPSQISLPDPSPLTFQGVRLGNTKIQGRGSQTQSSFKGI